MGIKKKFIYLFISIFIVLMIGGTAFATDTIEVTPMPELELPEQVQITRPASVVIGKPAGDTSSVVSFSDSNLANALASLAGCTVPELTTNTLLGFSGTLDLSDKNISELQGIENLTNVEYLILNKNPIYSRTELGRLEKLTNLKGLEIAALSISAVPSSICAMDWLDYLNIDANRLETLPSSFSNLELEGLSCNYCFFDVSKGSSTVEKIKSATKTADYQYQLPRLEHFHVTCEEMGVAVMHWNTMPDVAFGNGAKAVIKRYSVCEPREGESRGSWKDSVSPSGSSYTFNGLNGAISYSFDASVDYYIKNTSYDGKYIKNYQKVLFVPKPQPTPTPLPTPTPEVTAEPTPEVTPAPEITAVPEQQATPQITATAVSTVVPTSQPASNNEGDNFLDTLTTLVFVLIFLIIVLLIVLIVRMYRQPRQ